MAKAEVRKSVGSKEGACPVRDADEQGTAHRPERRPGAPRPQSRGQGRDRGGRREPRHDAQAARHPRPACHPSVPPDTPKGRDRGEELEQSPNAAQAALEERGQAAGELSRASLDGFFSAGSGWTAASHMPADTAQCSASAMTNRSRAKRSAWRIWLSSRPNPLDLKSENIASMPQRKP